MRHGASVDLKASCRWPMFCLFVSLAFDRRHNIARNKAARRRLLSVFGCDHRKQLSRRDGKGSVFSNHLYPVGREHLCHFSTVAAAKRGIKQADVGRVHRTWQCKWQSRELRSRVGGDTRVWVIVPIKKENSCCSGDQDDGRCQQGECFSSSHRL
jgi:hypothetical protein